MPISGQGIRIGYPSLGYFRRFGLQPLAFSIYKRGMIDFSSVLGAVIPIFGIALVGLVIRKLNWLTEEADTSLLRVNINLLLPCLILDAALGNRALLQWKNLIIAPLVGFGTVAAGMLMALWAARRLAGLSGNEGRTFGATVGLYNYGYLPVPLAILLFGSETAGVLFVHNLGVELALWTLGIMLFTGSSLGGEWRRIINAPLLTIYSRWC